MTSKTMKTVLFASLIATMILPFGMNTAFAETISDEIVEERNFSKVNHKTFQEYVDLPREDNAWNSAMIKENIKNYNIESKIGHDVDGYELLALDVQEQKLQNKYNPSLAEEKLHEWVLANYELPNDKKSIKDSIVSIAGQNHLGHAKQVADSLNRLANLGVVSPDIHRADSTFWDAVIYDSYCELNGDCNSTSPELSFVSFTNPTIQRVAYVNHVATIYVVYDHCGTTGQTCSEFKSHSGSGIKTTNFAPPGNAHVADASIYTSLTSWSDVGDNVSARAQVTSPVAGTVHLATDDDGYVSSVKNITHPNYYANSIPNIEFKSYAMN